MAYCVKANHNTRAVCSLKIATERCLNGAAGGRPPFMEAAGGRLHLWMGLVSVQQHSVAVAIYVAMWPWDAVAMWLCDSMATMDARVGSVCSTSVGEMI